MFPEVYKLEKDHFSGLYFYPGRWLAQIFTDFISKASNTPCKIIFKINTCTAMYIMELTIIINKTNDLILNLTPENVTQHSRIVTTTRKGSSTPTKMSKIIGRQIH